NTFQLTAVVATSPSSPCVRTTSRQGNQPCPTSIVSVTDWPSSNRLIGPKSPGRRATSTNSATGAAIRSTVRRSTAADPAAPPRRTATRIQPNSTAATGTPIHAGNHEECCTALVEPISTPVFAETRISPTTVRGVPRALTVASRASQVDGADDNHPSATDAPP